jgi:glycerophosphoryl diester phosphodiesterase
VPQLSAHRGGPEAVLEPNSLEAIRAACDLGVDLIEFDVRVTGDHQFIVFHDDRLIVDGHVRLVAEVAAADVYRGHVDLKDTRADVEIADLCAAHLGPEGFILTTLRDDSVRRIRAERPELRVGLSLSGMSSRTGRLRIGWPSWRGWIELFPPARIRRCDANLVALNYRLARLGLLGWAHRRRVPVLIWTVNTDKLIRAAQKDHRVWAYTTDFPRLALRLAAAGSADPGQPTGGVS